MKSKQGRRQACATSVEDLASNTNVQLTATANFKVNWKTQQAHKTNYTDKFCNIKKVTICIQWEHCQFQASQQLRKGNDLAVSIDTIKHFWAK